MFPKDVYRLRRQRLASDVGGGVILFPGNKLSPINYRENAYPFRQDSSFLYFWGQDLPNLDALIDIDESKEIVFGDEMTFEDYVWSGQKPSLQSSCSKAAVQDIEPAARLEEILKQATSSGRPVHFLPQYRTGNILKISRLLDIDPDNLGDAVSPELIRAVVAQRSIKDMAEIEQIETALDVTCDMHKTAMKMTSPGRYEFEVVGAMESTAYARNGSRMAYPTIFSVKGDVLHNPSHGNIMEKGQMAVNDSGAESPMHYASDITRTIPVVGTFSNRQKEIYSIVLEAQKSAIHAIRPGIAYRRIHKNVCLQMAVGLKQIDLMLGDIEEAVETGAHTLFFPHGLGHMLGLDVHDMEGLGEDNVGYSDTIKRSGQFGTRKLRMAKELETGFVVTVEPGLYFIPQLIEKWMSDGRFKEFINYENVKKYKGFGGIRIEDNVLVTEDGSRVLGKPIPKDIKDVEALSA